MQDNSPKPSYSGSLNTLKDTNSAQDNNSDINNSDEGNQENDNNSSDKNNIGSGSSSNSGNSEGGGIIQENLPSDINSTNCGFYYEKYNVCAGTCEQGKCISENRSCYCKLNWIIHFYKLINIFYIELTT